MQVFIEYEFITVFIHSCQEKKKKTENGTVKMVGWKKRCVCEIFWKRVLARDFTVADRVL